MSTLERFASLAAIMVIAAGTLAGCSDATEAAVEIENASEKVSEELITPEPQVEGEPATESRTIFAGGLSRDYIVTTPPGVEHRGDLPLIIAFHGYKNDASMMRTLTQFDQANAVVAYMDGVNDAWAPAPYAETTGKQDLEFFDRVRQEMIDQYPVNPAKVFVAGMSNGGGFAAYAGCHRAHQITGIATVSAAYYDDVFKGCRPSPVKQIDMHGTADHVMEYGGGVRHNEAYKAAFTVMEEAARRNYCQPEPVRANIQRPGEEFVWEGCDAQLRHFRIDGGGHVWPGSKSDLRSATQPADGFATRQILDFFGISYRGPLGPEDQPS